MSDLEKARDLLCDFRWDAEEWMRRGAEAHAKTIRTDAYHCVERVFKKALQHAQNEDTVDIIQDLMGDALEAILCVDVEP